MITIDTTKFKEYEKLIQYARNVESKYRSHFSINLNNSYAEVTGSNFVFGFTFTFSADEKPEEDYPVFYVSIMEFLSLCRAYDSIDMDLKDYKFYSGDDKFSISTFVEDDAVSFKDEIDIYSSFINNDLSTQLEVSGTIVSEMTTAMSFSPKAGDGDPLEGLRLYHNDIFASDHTSLYQNRISEKSFDESIDIPLGLIFVLRQLPMFGDFNLYFGNDAILIHEESNSFDLYYSQLASLEFPEDPYDEEFRSAFDHETGFTIDKNLFKENVKFFEPFAQSVQNEAIHIVINKDNITISVSSGVIAGNKNIEIDSVDESIIGTDLLVPRYLVMKALNVLESDDDIEVRVDPEKHAITFREPEVNENKYIVITRMYEDN